MEFKSQKKKNYDFSDVSSRSSKPKEKSKSWLFDDDEWVELKKAVALDNVRRKRVSFDKPKNSLKKLFSKINNLNFKQKLAFSTCLLIILCSGLYLSLKKDSSSQVAGTNETRQFDPSQPLPREKPEFPILYPGQKNAENMGEIVKNSPPGQPPVYVYTDSIGSINLQVSQQQLPDNLKTNQDSELQKIAESFQANSVIQVDSVKVYHGLSASGVQSLILVKGNLLILIKSSQKITDETWAAYISALHT